MKLMELWDESHELQMTWKLGSARCEVQDLQPDMAKHGQMMSQINLQNAYSTNQDPQNIS